VKGAAAYLSCTVWCIRSLIWSRGIPYLKLGKRFLIDRADLDKLVEREKIAV
jgi:excisionase family DNA binding protein